MSGPTPTKTSIKKPTISGGQKSVKYNNQTPALSATPDAALSLIERIESRIEKIEFQLSSHHDDITRFKASLGTLKTLASALGVAIGLLIAYFSLISNQRNTNQPTESTKISNEDSSRQNTFLGNNANSEESRASKDTDESLSGKNP